VVVLTRGAAYADGSSRIVLLGKLLGISADSMAYTPQQIANYFLERADEEGMPLTQMKLIKLVYISYGWYLALKGEPLFSESIEAWQHGPVIPSIYHEFKDFGRQAIDRKAMELDLDTWEMVVPSIPASDREVRMILNMVWEAYKRFTGWQLREMTHQPGSPWSKVYKEGSRKVRIDDKEITEHYQQRIKGYLASARADRAARTAS
jgi:uncharacterized phage-associated protein